MLQIGKKAFCVKKKRLISGIMFRRLTTDGIAITRA